MKHARKNKNKGLSNRHHPWYYRTYNCGHRGAARGRLASKRTARAALRRQGVEICAVALNEYGGDSAANLI